MKLLLIHVWNENEIAYRGKFSGLFAYPSLTIATVYALIPKDVFEQIDVVDEHTQTVNYDKTHYDVVMMSTETSAAATAFRHAKNFHERGTYVVGGGYFPSAMPEECLQHFDTVIQGPGEISIPQFVRDYVAGKPQPIYKNYDVKPEDFVVPARDKITRHKKLHVPGIIANPGCNNVCKYCSMRTMWKSVCRPVEDVIDELKNLHSKMVVFYDPNFFANREYATALMNAMIPLKMLWASNATADIGYDDEILDLAYRSGCRGLLLGLESRTKDSLKGAAKMFQQSDHYKEVIRGIHKHGIAVNGCFVLGFDGDTEESILSMPEWIDSLELDLCRFAILTPYPGTAQYREFEKQDRLITKEWARYTQHEAVFEPANMSVQRLNELYRIVWKEAFSWKRLWHRVRHSPWRGHWYNCVLFGANLGFKFLGIDQKKNGKRKTSTKENS